MNIPMALQPPQGDLALITEDMLEEAIRLSRSSPRKRIILPLHKDESHTLHRMFNIVQPGSYIRPHSHQASNKSESLILLRGAICYLTFDGAGQLKTHHHIKAGTATFGVDTEPSVVHAFYATEADTILYEVKPGPYVRELDKGFAPWSPEEGTPEADQLMQEWAAATSL